MKITVFGLLVLCSVSAVANDCTYSQIVNVAQEGETFHQVRNEDAQRILEAEGFTYDVDSKNIVQTSTKRSVKLLSLANPLHWIEKAVCFENSNAVFLYSDKLEVVGGSSEKIASFVHKARYYESCGVRSQFNGKTKTVVNFNHCSTKD